MNVTYTFTDHVGGKTILRVLRANGFDTEAEALGMYAGIEAQQASAEVSAAFSVAAQGSNPDRVAVYQEQADFDRRLLGLVMTLDNANTFLGAIDFFQAMEIRGGANAAQRATYLGVILDDYQLTETRFNQIMGTATVLEADQLRVWEELMEGWN
jgi:hypothetical protein